MILNRPNKTWRLVWLLLLLPEILWSQNDTLKLNKYFIGKCLRDSKHLVTAPFHWDQKDWTKAGVFAIGTAALTLVDQPVNDLALENRNDLMETISSEVIGPFGSTYGVVLLSGFFAYGVLAKDSKALSTSLLAGESFVLAGFFVHVPKELFGRWRPGHYPKSDPYDWKGPFNGNSFPSGHTIVAFSIASVFANQYRDTRWVPIASYSLASLVGLSRVYDNKHWFSDVVAGAVLGTLIGNMVCKKENNSRLSIIPFGNSHYQGLRLAIVL